jgi:hypothetical protein
MLASPPRTIVDIAAILDQEKPDSERQPCAALADLNVTAGPDS